jgi:hypothetical protein
MMFGIISLIGLQIKLIEGQAFGKKAENWSIRSCILFGLIHQPSLIYMFGMVHSPYFDGQCVHVDLPSNFSPCIISK